MRMFNKPPTVPDIVNVAFDRGYKVIHGAKHIIITRADGKTTSLPRPTRSKRPIQDVAVVGAIVRFLEGK